MYTVCYSSHSEASIDRDDLRRYGHGDNKEEALKAAKDLKALKPKYTVWLCEEIKKR